MNVVTQKPVRISVTSHNSHESGISLEGLTALEVERAEGMVRGQWWMKCEDGRLEFVSTREIPPAPTEDHMLPEWRRPHPDHAKAEVQLTLIDTERPWDGHYASIIIQHLCGYGYTPERYTLNAQFLECCGFGCMRSRRGDSGQFWEAWFLPGLWAALGPLKEHVQVLPKEEHFDAAMKFLARNVAFGTLDVSVQRMCQVID